MARYHMRKSELEITDPNVIEEILKQEKYATLALARGGEPYVDTLNYGYDPEARALYFHAADEGLKLAFIRDNPAVCGTVIEDRGYIKGRCDYAFRLVVFWERIRRLESGDDKAHGLGCLVDHLEEASGQKRERLLADPGRLRGVAVLRLIIDVITGKARDLR